MKAKKVFNLSALLLAFLLLIQTVAGPGCGGGDRKAAGKVEEAISILSSSRSLLDDLISLDRRLDDLGTRFTEVQDTVAEGKSLAAMALVDVQELENRYLAARELLQEVAEAGAGDRSEYARLALQAVDAELEAFSSNRRLLETVAEMLDIMGMAENTEQLSYYMGEIDRLSAEVTELFRRGSEYAEAADDFHRRHDL